MCLDNYYFVIGSLDQVIELQFVLKYRKVNNKRVVLFVKIYVNFADG